MKGEEGEKKRDVCKWVESWVKGEKCRGWKKKRDERGDMKRMDEQ